MESISPANADKPHSVKPTPVPKDWDVELVCECGAMVYLCPAGPDWPGLSEGGCTSCDRSYVDWWEGTFCFGGPER